MRLTSLIKLPSMSEVEVKKVMEEQNICRIAFIDDQYPYIAPFQYVYLNNALYFHVTEYGKKMEILSKNKNVCVVIEKFSSNLSEFSFVKIQGSLEKVSDTREKEKIAKLMVEKAKKTYSKEFLAVHGFDKKKGWEAFAREKFASIYKLIEKKRIGLKNT